MRTIVVAALLLICCAMPAGATEIAGVALDDQVTVGDGTVLSLNGAGVRSKFFFKIYVAALYLEKKTSDPAAVIGAEGAKRMLMHFLYDEVGKDDLVEAWNDGFTGNATPEQLASLADRIKTFNELFTTVKAGDQVVLDYIPGTGTVVTIRGERVGVVDGKEFNDLLLSIWLGKEPVTDDLKAALLGS